MVNYICARGICMNYDVIVIGAGVVGCAAAMELTKHTRADGAPLRVLVLERGEDVCTGTSKANSAIVHAGFDALPGTKKALYNVRGSKRMESLCAELQIPYKRCGALVLCFEEAEIQKLRELLERGVKNGVEGVEILDSARLHELEPNVSEKAVAALWAPTSGIVCPFELTAAMAENAVRNGAEFRFDTLVTGLKPIEGGWQIETGQGSFTAACVVNAAGVYGDELHNMVSEDKITIQPRAGEYCLLDKKVGAVAQHTLFRLPSAMGKGILVTPTVHGNTLIGPTAHDVEDKEQTETTDAGLAEVMRMGQDSVPSLPRGRTITSFSGLRAHIVSGSDDFRIGAVAGAPGMFEAVGIESPGLSSAPAIGEELANEITAYLGGGDNAAYIPGREPVIRPDELSFEARQELVRQNPAYGQIVCRCERVSEGEIVDAIRRRPGARSLDGVKRRTRAGMGRCQGGFCAPRVMELLSRELGVPQTELTKNGGAPLVIGYTREEE